MTATNERHLGITLLVIALGLLWGRPSALFAAAPTPTRLSLEKCIDTAIKNNLELEIEYKKVKLAETRLGISYREFFPDVKLKASETLGELSAGDFEGRSFRMEGRQPLYHGGEIFASNQQAREVLKSSVAASRRIEEEIIFTVREAYFRLLGKKSILKQLQMDKMEAADFLKKIQEGVKDGVVAQIELLGVEYHLNQITNLYYSAIKDFKEAEYDLKAAMNVDAKEDVGILNYDLDIFDFSSQIFEVKQALQTIPQQIPALAASMETAFNQRDEILELRHKFNAEKYHVKVEKAKDYPSVDLVGNYGQAAEAFKQDKFDLDDEWLLGVELKWVFGGNTATYSYNQSKDAPKINTFESTKLQRHNLEFGVLDNLKVFSDQQEAGVQKLEAERDLEEKVKKIYKEVTTAYYDLYRSLSKVVLNAAGVNHQKRSYEILEFRYKNREIEPSALMEKRVELSQTVAEYEQAVTDFFIGLAKLDQAVGQDDFVQIKRFLK